MISMTYNEMKWWKEELLKEGVEVYGYKGVSDYLEAQKSFIELPIEVQERVAKFIESKAKELRTTVQYITWANSRPHIYYVNIKFVRKKCSRCGHSRNVHIRKSFKY